MKYQDNCFFFIQNSRQDQDKILINYTGLRGSVTKSRVGESDRILTLNVVVEFPQHVRFLSNLWLNSPK